MPEDAVFPWLTYELITGSWESGEIGLTVNFGITQRRSSPKCKGAGDQ
ncbi:MAG: hypothetical protein ACLVDB_01720 [Anaeromassilibacillus sp.]